MAAGPSAASLPTRAWTLISAVNLRTKILGMVLALVLILGSGVTLQVRATLSRTLMAQLQEESVSLGRDLAARSTDPLLINDLYNILQLLRETQMNNPDVRYAFILDHDGRVVAHTFGGGFPADLVSAKASRWTPTIVRQASGRKRESCGIPLCRSSMARPVRRASASRKHGCARRSPRSPRGCC